MISGRPARAARTVVVQAHPLDASCSSALLGRVRDGLEAAGEEHRVFRLCQGERPGPEVLAGTGQLVLVYPTWWGGQPAVLLDWLQELLLAPGALASVRRLVAVTTLGSSRLVNRVQGDWGRAHLESRVLQACTPGAGFEWLALYKIDRRSPAEIHRFLDLVRERFATSEPVPV